MADFGMLQTFHTTFEILFLIAASLSRLAPCVFEDFSEWWISYFET
jgi:hypothetical protein